MEFKKILLGFIIIGLFVSGCATAKKERKEDETGQKTSEIKDSQKDVKHYEELSHTLNMDGRGDYIIDEMCIRDSL